MPSIQQLTENLTQITKDDGVAFSTKVSVYLAATADDNIISWQASDLDNHLSGLLELQKTIITLFNNNYNLAFESGNLSTYTKDTQGIFDHFIQLTTNFTEMLEICPIILKQETFSIINRLHLFKAYYDNNSHTKALVQPISSLIQMLFNKQEAQLLIEKETIKKSKEAQDTREKELKALADELSTQRHMQDEKEQALLSSEQDLSNKKQKLESEQQELSNKKQKLESEQKKLSEEQLALEANKRQFQTEKNALSKAQAKLKKSKSASSNEQPKKTSIALEQDISALLNASSLLAYKSSQQLVTKEVITLTGISVDTLQKTGVLGKKQRGRELYELKVRTFNQQLGHSHTSASSSSSSSTSSSGDFVTIQLGDNATGNPEKYLVDSFTACLFPNKKGSIINDTTTFPVNQSQAISKCTPFIAWDLKNKTTISLFEIVGCKMALDYNKMAMPATITSQVRTDVKADINAYLVQLRSIIDLKSRCDTLFEPEYHFDFNKQKAKSLPEIVVYYGLTDVVQLMNISVNFYAKQKHKNSVSVSIFIEGIFDFMLYHTSLRVFDILIQHIQSGKSDYNHEKQSLAKILLSWMMRVMDSHHPHIKLYSTEFATLFSSALLLNIAKGKATKKRLNLGEEQVYTYNNNIIHDLTHCLSLKSVNTSIRNENLEIILETLFKELRKVDYVSQQTTQPIDLFLMDFCKSKTSFPIVEIIQKMILKQPIELASSSSSSSAESLSSSQNVITSSTSTEASPRHSGAAVETTHSLFANTTSLATAQKASVN